MKYLNSIYTPDMSGKQGNVIFSSNKYSKYSCMRKTPVDPNTIDQQNVRAGTAKIARLWPTLTPLQRQNWNYVASDYPFEKKGKRYFVTGFIFFMKLNRNLYEINEPFIFDISVDTTTMTQNFTNFEVQIVNTPTGNDLLLFISPAINANTKIKLAATRSVISSEQYGTTKTHKITVLDSSFVSGSSIKEYYIQKYGSLPGPVTKAFFDIKSTAIATGFSNKPIHSEAFGI